MALLTATDVTVLTNISASVATIIASGLVDQVTNRINEICNNYFTTDLYLQGTVTFNATALTVVSSGGDFAAEGFAAGDEVYIYRSYRNDGYYDVASVTTATLTLASGSTVVDELSGRSVYVSVVRWPASLKQTAAEMVAWDLEGKREHTPGVRSRSLGPWSESYEETGTQGYPASIIEALRSYTIARVM